MIHLCMYILRCVFVPFESNFIIVCPISSLALFFMMVYKPFLWFYKTIECLRALSCYCQHVNDQYIYLQNNNNTHKTNMALKQILNGILTAVSKIYFHPQSFLGIFKINMISIFYQIVSHRKRGKFIICNIISTFNILCCWKRPKMLAYGSKVVV